MPRLKGSKGMFYALNSTDTLRSKHVFVFDSNANATAAMRSLYWRTCVPFLPPLLCNVEKLDFVCLVAAMPGRHSGDQVHKVKKMPRHVFG